MNVLNDVIYLYNHSSLVIVILLIISSNQVPFFRVSHEKAHLFLLSPKNTSIIFLTTAYLFTYYLSPPSISHPLIISPSVHLFNTRKTNFGVEEGQESLNAHVPHINRASYYRNLRD